MGSLIASRRAFLEKWAPELTERGLSIADEELRKLVNVHALMILCKKPKDAKFGTCDLPISLIELSSPALQAQLDEWNNRE